MNNFIFENKTKVIFAKGTEEQIGRELNAKKILLHYGGGSIKKSGLYQKVVNSIKKEKIEIVELGGVEGNPKLDLVHKGITLCKENNIDFILAVGGGSVIDSAKAIGVGYYYDGDVWDFFENLETPKQMLPVGVVLTIPAAGSETSIGSVITNSKEKTKRVIAQEFMRPDFCILNPEINLTLSSYQTFCGISDMLSHVMERYFTRVKGVELTDRLCEAVMITVIDNAYKLLENPNNYDARAEILWSGTIAHNDIIGTGRDGDWASHGIEHEISALTDLAHGAGLSIIFPAWMKYVYKTDIKRFVQFANRVFKVDINLENMEDTALKGIKSLEQFYSDISLPTKFKEIDFNLKDIEIMAKKVTNNNTQTIGQFKELNMEDIIQIYNLAT